MFFRQDFVSPTSNRSYPPSCCSVDSTENVSKKPLASAVIFKSDDLAPNSINNIQKSNLSEINDLAWSHVITAAKGGETKTVITCRTIFPQVLLYFIYLHWILISIFSFNHFYFRFFYTFQFKLQ